MLDREHVNLRQMNLIKNMVGKALQVAAAEIALAEVKMRGVRRNVLQSLV